MPANMRLALVAGGLCAGLTAGVSAQEGSLVDAVTRGDVATVRQLAGDAATVAATQPDGATALHWAAYEDRGDIASILIAAGAELDAANDYGITPIMLACQNGSTPMVQLLLGAGANADRARDTGETPLMTCARTGARGAVEALVAVGADANATEKWRGQTALMWASSEAHADAVETLLDAGADVNARSESGYTALLIASRRDEPAIVDALVAAGGDANYTAPDGMTPLQVATVRGNSRVARRLLAHGADPNAGHAGFTPLHWAAGSWHTELTGNLQGIETTREAEWRSMNGVQEGKVALVEALLAHGADIDARLERMPPQFGFASQRFRVSMVDSTPFLLASMDANLDVMQVLAEAGADVTLGTDENTSPLMVASGLGQVPAETRVIEDDSIRAVEYLLTLGADVNRRNTIGRSALHGAAHIRSDTIVQLLVDHGAEVEVGDIRGITPLMIAEGGGHILLPGLGGGSTADLLRELGGGETRPEDFIRPYDEGAIR